MERPEIRASAQIISVLLAVEIYLGEGPTSQPFLGTRWRIRSYHFSAWFSPSAGAAGWQHLEDRVRSPPPLTVCCSVFFVASLTHHLPVSYTVVCCRRRQHYTEAKIGIIVVFYWIRNWTLLSQSLSVRSTHLWTLCLSCFMLLDFVSLHFTIREQQ